MHMIKETEDTSMINGFISLAYLTEIFIVFYYLNIVGFIDFKMNCITQM